jgi:TonB family protein
MIATWMIAATLFAVLLGLAALAIERALRLLGRQSRAPWAFALAGAVMWPVLAPIGARIFVASLPAAGLAQVSAAPSAARAITDGLGALPPDWAARADAAVLILWACVSVVLLARLALAFRALRRLERAAKHDVVEGVPVLVTDSLGPAVFGMRQPRLIVPHWLLDLDAPLRALVLRHEQEHCRARDPQLTLAVAVALALMPWNAGVWWIARRLRLALELDCDVRVMRAAGDPQRYGKLLLFIAQRQSQTRLAPMLAESNSHLSQRITAMNASRPSKPVTRVAICVLVAGAALVFACSPRIGSDLTAPKPAVPGSPSLVAGGSGATYFEFQVERPVMQAPGSKVPRFPEILKSAGVEGKVLASFIVDTTGLAVPESFKVLKATHELFAQAVRDAVPAMRFLPAQVGGRPVKQLVEEPFVFAIGGPNVPAKEGSTRPAPGRVHTLGEVIVTVPNPASAPTKIP